MLLNSFERVICQSRLLVSQLSTFFSCLHASPLLLQVKSLKEDLQKGNFKLIVHIVKTLTKIILSGCTCD